MTNIFNFKTSKIKLNYACKYFFLQSSQNIHITIIVVSVDKK